MKLQLALDDITFEAAITLLAQVKGQVDIIELGTPFAYTNPISAIGEIKALYPEAKVLADYKILDGGEFMASLAFGAGADIVTVSASAHDETIAGAVKAGRRFDREVLADTMGVPLRDIPARARVARQLGADYICVHTSLDVPDAPDPLESIRLVRQGAPDAKLAVAGGINLGTLPRLLTAAPEVVIVGGALCKASDPAQVARQMKAMMEKGATG